MLFLHFLQEILPLSRDISNIYTTTQKSESVGDAIALLQCVASHPDTSIAFIRANIPMHLYPFLNLTSGHRNKANLRLISLAVFGALAKGGNKEAVQFLINSGIFPSCYKCLQLGKELTRTVAAFTLEKLLTHDEGVSHCCASAESINAICSALGAVVVEQFGRGRGIPSKRLLKLIIGCYLKLSKVPRSRDGLRKWLSGRLELSPFIQRFPLIQLFSEDSATTTQLQQLLNNIDEGAVVVAQQYQNIDDECHHMDFLRTAQHAVV